MNRVVDYLNKIKEAVVGDPLPPKRVAAGWALGMFVGCSIPFGLQLLVSVPLAVAFKISKIGATVGTLVTNPVTIFFIYPAQTMFVYRLMFGEVSASSLPQEWTYSTVMALSGSLIVSFLLGGLLLALVLTPITYFVVYGIVSRYRGAKSV